MIQIYNSIKGAFSKKSHLERPSNNTDDVLRALFRWIGRRQAVMIPDNFDNYITDVYQRNPIFAAVVDKIAETEANIQYDIVRELPDGEEEVIAEGQAYDYWHEPNDQENNYEFRVAANIYFLVLGNTFINGIAPRGGINEGKKQEMRVMPAHAIEIVSDGVFKPVSGYQMRELPGMVFDPETVLHIKRFNPEYMHGQHLYGMSKVKSALLAISASNDAYNAKATKFQNGGADGFLQEKDENNNTLTVEQQKAFQDKLMKFTSARSKEFGKIPISNILMEYVKIGDNVVNMQVLDSILSDQRTVCNIYGISSRLFNDPAASTFNNTQSDERRMYTDVIMPLSNNIAKKFTHWYLRSYQEEGGEKLKFKPNFSKVECLQTDRKASAEAIKGTPGITLRHVYDMMDLAIPEDIEQELLDKPLMPVGYQFLEDMNAQDDIDELTALLQRSGSRDQEPVN